MVWIPIILYMCSAVAFYVGVYHLSFAFKFRREQGHFAFSLLCISMASYDFCAAGLYRSDCPANSASWQEGQTLSVAFIVIFVLHFIYDLVQRENRKNIWRLSGFFVILGLLIHFTSLGVRADVPAIKRIDWLDITYQEAELGHGVTLLYIIVLFVLVHGYLLVYKRYRAGDTFLKPAAYMLGIYLACSISDMLVAVGILPFIYTMEYSFILLILTMAYGLQNKMMGFVQKQIETVSAQEKLIQTIEGVQKNIPEVIKELREVSQSMASQAAQHASMAEQLSSSVSMVRSTTDETARAAEETLKIAERTRGFSTTSTERIHSVEKGFEETKPIMDNLENDIEELTEKISSTEDILEFIRQMANQIKILAVNAAIQASKAGEYGVGFRVVANELKSMINSVEDYLVNSRNLLESIRNKASESTSMTQETNRLLARQLLDLNQASAFITNIQDAYGDTSQSVEIIANASQKQLSTIAEVVASIGQLTEAANKLSNSADTVLGGIEKIVETEKAFDDILKTRSI